MNRAPVFIKLVRILIHVLYHLRLNRLNLVLVVARTRLVDKIARYWLFARRLEFRAPACTRILLLCKILCRVIVAWTKRPRKELILGVVSFLLIHICVLVTGVVSRPLRRSYNVMRLASPTLTRRLSISLAIGLPGDQRVVVRTLTPFIDFDFSRHSLRDRRVTLLSELIFMARIKIGARRA